MSRRPRLGAAVAGVVVAAGVALVAAPATATPSHTFKNPAQVGEWSTEELSEVVVDGDGQATVAWNDSGAVDVASRGEGAFNWADTRLASSGASLPSVATNAAGQTLVAYYVTNTVNGGWFVFARTRAPGSDTWSAAEKIGQTSQHVPLGVFVETSGVGRVAWVQGNGSTSDTARMVTVSSQGTFLSGASTTTTGVRDVVLLDRPSNDVSLALATNDGTTKRIQLTDYNARGGTFGTPTVLDSAPAGCPPCENLTDLSAAQSSTGNLVVAWIDNGLDVKVQAAARFGSTWTTTATLVTGQPRVPDTGFQHDGIPVVAWTGDGVQWATWDSRGGGWLDPEYADTDTTDYQVHVLTRGSGDLAFAFRRDRNADGLDNNYYRQAPIGEMDPPVLGVPRSVGPFRTGLSPTGDVHAVWLNADDAPTIDSAVLDDTAPTAYISAPTSLYALGDSIPAKWGGSDIWSEPLTYDTRVESAARDGVFGAETSWRTATTTTAGLYPVTPGRTYCFSSRSTDDSLNTSAWTGHRCSTTPVDDRSTAGSGWALQTGSAYYRQTAKYTTVHGRSLVLNSIKARRVYLVASRCGSCGSVRVSIGGVTVGDVDLAGATLYRGVFALPVPATARSGQLKILVTSASGKLVRVDGVVLRPF